MNAFPFFIWSPTFSYANGIFVKESATDWVRSSVPNVGCKAGMEIFLAEKTRNIPSISRKGQLAGNAGVSPAELSGRRNPSRRRPRDTHARIAC
jgi:hypothetical protein